MGTYYLIANHTKREFFHPHALGTGAKDYELPFRAGPSLLLLLNKRWRDDEIAVYADFEDDYDRVRYGDSGDVDPVAGKVAAYNDISDEALSLFRERYLPLNDTRLSPYGPSDDRQVRGHGPFFRLYDPDAIEGSTGPENWMRGFLAMHDPEAAAREDARDAARLVEWLRKQGNRYEGLSARETLGQIITDIEAGEHKKEKGDGA
jgi:hypothetical protein